MSLAYLFTLILPLDGLLPMSVDQEHDASTSWILNYSDSCNWWRHSVVSWSRVIRFMQLQQHSTSWQSCNMAAVSRPRHLMTCKRHSTVYSTVYRITMLALLYSCLHLLSAVILLHILYSTRIMHFRFTASHVLNRIYRMYRDRLTALHCVVLFATAEISDS